MSEEDPVERKDATERRVYNLPASLLERLRAYQVSQGISSEAEAARRLLDTALQLRDTFAEILNGLEKRFKDEKDLRVLASELIKHILVQEVTFQEGALIFKLYNGDSGQVSANGDLYFSPANARNGDWTDYVKWRKAQHRSPGPTSSWDAPGGSDLDEEIPF